MNPVLEKFGVSLLPGRLVCPTENFAQDLVPARLTRNSVKFSFHFANMRRYNQVATMPSAAGLDISGVSDKGFESTVLLVADTAKGRQYWSEVETTNFVDDTARVNPKVGEMIYTDPIPMMVALSRKVGEREQKIMILGDADCLSTSELSRRYRGISSSNFSLINVIFFWMSDGEAPVDIRRPGYIDNDILVSTTAFTVAKVIFMGVIPVALLLFAIILWIRRKGR
jgi:ABC-2 type transport system permease protein